MRKTIFRTSVRHVSWQKMWNRESKKTTHNHKQLFISRLRKPRENRAFATKSSLAGKQLLKKGDTCQHFSGGTRLLVAVLTFPKATHPTHRPSSKKGKPPLQLALHYAGLQPAIILNPHKHVHESFNPLSWGLHQSSINFLAERNWWRITLSSCWVSCKRFR